MSSSYDEARRYSVTPAGEAIVEVTVLASTHTMTKADAEPSDDDRAWESAIGIGTRTQARNDRDNG